MGVPGGPALYRSKIHAGLITGLLAFGLVLSPHTTLAANGYSGAGDAADCQTTANDAAKKANDGSNKAADLSAIGYTLMAAALAAHLASIPICSAVPMNVAACEGAQAAAFTADAAAAAFTAANGSPSANASNSAGLAALAAKTANDAKNCKGKEDPTPAASPSASSSPNPWATPSATPSPAGLCAALAAANLNNDLCGPKRDVIRDSLNQVNNDLRNNPNLPALPGGTTANDLQRSVDGGFNALDGLDALGAESSNLGAGTGAGAGTGSGAGRGNGSGTGHGNGRGDLASGKSGYGGEGDDDFFGGGSGKTKAGPSDRKGLGNALIKNGLTMIDQESGNELTLWQRGTRRYQGGPEGRRARALARMEWIRQEAARKGKTLPSLADAQTAPTRSPTAVPKITSFSEVGPMGGLTQTPVKTALPMATPASTEPTVKVKHSQ